TVAAAPPRVIRGRPLLPSPPNVVEIPPPRRSTAERRAGKLAVPMRFANQVAIVTGGGRGIGHAIALRLAGEGARVAVVSRTEANAVRTADEINAKHAGLSKAYAVDVASHAAVKTLAEQILADFSRIDILVNNAGLTKDN